jgi:hypothetical protein
LSSTRSQPSCSNARVKSSSLVSTFAPVCHQGRPSQVQPISSEWCCGRSAMYRVLPIGWPLARSLIAQGPSVPAAAAASASSIQLWKRSRVS